MSTFVKLGVAGIALSFLACSSHSSSVDDDLPAVATDEAIVHGALDRDRHPAVVAIATRDGHLCSGSLVAPNVVLTARHCVAHLVDENIVCPGAFGAALAPGDLAIVLGSDASTGTLGAYAHKVHVPPGNAVCDADIALLELDRPISGIEPMRLARDISPQKGERIVAVGFGLTHSTSGTAGVRRLRMGVPITAVTDHELTVGESTCFGDSGGPAIDEQTGEILGVLSRGGGGCEGQVWNVYTRISPWASLIDPLVHTPSGGGAPAPDLGDMGDPCTKGSTCASGVCVSAQPEGYCSRACGTGTRCPTGYRCAKSGDHSVCARKS
ncbi:MAG: S1 family peptidase [Polyangiales bacterium]